MLYRRGVVGILNGQATPGVEGELWQLAMYLSTMKRRLHLTSNPAAAARELKQSEQPGLVLRIVPG
jgi:hypothetical protein